MACCAGLADSGVAVAGPDERLLKSDEPLDSHPAKPNAMMAMAAGAMERVRLRDDLSASDLVTVTPP
jgi:hypothetical protein